MTTSSYAPSAPPSCIAWFDDVSRRDVASVGGKGANLGELTQAGFAVPPGFVVTAGAHLQAMDDAGARTDLRGRVDAADVDDPRP
jgi:pyruvate,water dikinase